jgi:hypothetical protein
MVGSPFIYIECGQRRSLLNTTQIALVNIDDVDINSKESRSLYDNLDPVDGKIYVMRIFLTFGKPSEYLFVTAADRDVMYDKVVAALAPSAIIIDTSPDVPKKTASGSDQ